MREKLYLYSESSQSVQDIYGVTSIVGDWETADLDVHIERCKWIGKRSVDDHCRFCIVSESQLITEYENYGWDYSNCDGFGSASFYTASWNEYIREEGLI